MPTHETPIAFADELALALVRLGEPAEPWHLRPNEDDSAKLIVARGVGLVRGRLDGAGYTVRATDLPTRKGWSAVLEVSS